MRIAGPFNSGTAAGNAGQATANQDTTVVLKGKLLGGYVKYNDSPPATTDIVIKTKGTSPNVPSYNLIAKTNYNTSGLFLVRLQAVGTDLAAITGIYVPIPINDLINISIDQADAGDSIDVWLFLED